jgi:hypothetical protein
MSLLVLEERVTAAVTAAVTVAEDIDMSLTSSSGNNKNLIAACLSPDNKSSVFPADAPKYTVSEKMRDKIGF